MKVNWKKLFLNWIVPVVISTAFIMLIDVGINGMYLIGVPDAENVNSVTIAWPEKSETGKEYSDLESIDLAISLTGFLKYSLFAQAEELVPSGIEITYSLQNGDTITVVGNENTVWWKGKAHALKQKGAFVKLAEGIFFFDEVANH